MATQRETVRLNHHFFQRLRDLKDFFHSFEETEHYRAGAAQDWEVELQLRANRGTVGDDEAQGLVEYQYDSVLIQTMQRQCQIIMLYSTFESLCKETGARRKNDRNLVLHHLEQAALAGMQSTVWPQDRNSIEVFIKLRNHLVHEGLEATEELLTELTPLIHSVVEFPGASATEKICWLRARRTLITIPRQFVETVLAKLEELGAALLIRVDGEQPDPPLDPYSFLRP